MNRWLVGVVLLATAGCSAPAPTATVGARTAAVATPVATAAVKAVLAGSPPTATGGVPTAAATPASAAAAAAPKPPTKVDVPAGTLRLVRADGTAAEVKIEYAADESTRQRGLMFRESIPADAGMLFVFPGDTDGAFWMKDTLVPLSIAFIDAQGRIVDIKDMQPRSLDLVQSAARYRYALEVNQGFFGRNNVRVGDRAEFRLAGGTGFEPVTEL